MIYKYFTYFNPKQLLVVFGLAINLLFVAGEAFAQPAEFSILNYDRGCNPLTIEVLDRHAAARPSPDLVLWDFGDGSDLTTNPVHTYTAPGVYNIVMTVNNGTTGERSDPKSVYVFEPIEPDFKVSFCEGGKVRIQLPSDENYTRYEIDFGDLGMNVFADSGSFVEHVYTDLTPKIITVTGGFVRGGGDCGKSTFELTPVESILAANIRQIEVLGTGEIRLEYDLPQPIAYILEESIGNGTYTEIEELTGDNSLIELPNRDVDNSSYCYRIKVVNSCDGEEAFSNAVCSMPITVSSEDGQNQISWGQYPIGGTFESYKLVRTDGSGGFQTDFTEITTTSYTDENVVCNLEYCYQIEASLSNNVQSISRLTCITASSSKPPVAATNLLATVEGGQVIVTWENPSGAAVTKVKRVDSDGNLIELVGNDAINFVDDSVNTNASTYCYSITFEDLCGNASEVSAESCTILLSAQKEEEGNVLSWTPFSGMSGDFSYTIEILDESGQVVRTVESLPSSTTSFVDLVDDSSNPVTFYRIIAVSTLDPSVRSRSNVAEVVAFPELEIPTAFTPNGDNLNDTFYPRGKALGDFKMKIFNRWGEQVFEANNPTEEWDGTYLGRMLEAGPYTYQIEARGINGEELNKAGIVMMIK